jgi:tetratricopeptide (TPR) repeat protein
MKNILVAIVFILCTSFIFAQNDNSWNIIIEKNKVAKEKYKEGVINYQNKNYILSCNNFQDAIEIYPRAKFYYSYGLSLMDMGKYDEAKEKFLEFIDKLFAYENPYLGYLMAILNTADMEELYTYDPNGVISEVYFALYNIGCIYALTGNFIIAFDYIKLAIENGYPYLSYIFRDSDLKAFFEGKEGENRKNVLTNIYNNGFNIDLSGTDFLYLLKVSENQWDHESNVQLIFVTDNNVILTRTDEIRYGTYEVKNYIIIIHFTKEKRLHSLKQIYKWGSFNHSDDIPINRQRTAYSLKYLRHNSALYIDNY